MKIELKKIKNLVPNSDLVLLDSLALGGDTICAEVAMGLGYEIEVPLPFEIDEYWKDFDEDVEIKFDDSYIEYMNRKYPLREYDDYFEDTTIYENSNYYKI